MSNKVNSQYFSKDQVESGEFKQLLDFLMNNCYGAGKYYNDIHIRPEDCGAFVIEWTNVPWDNSFGGKFAYIDIDNEEAIMKRIEFPDGTSQWALPQEEEYLRREWSREHFKLGATDHTSMDME